MTLSKTLLFLFIGYFFLYSCNSTEKYKQDLLSDDQNKIDEACFKLGKARDTSAIKLLLTKILDPRMSTNIFFKGMTVNYCRLGALNKISGSNFGIKLNQFKVDTAATNLYLDWAVKQGYLNDKNEVDIYYLK
jgi:hypothetical protein